MLPLSDDASYALYKAMWDKGFQTSSVFMMDKDYLAGKEQARIKCEGLIYKMLVARFAFPAIITCLKICVALLGKSESVLEAAPVLEDINSDIQAA